ncbi:hypothetical protein CRYUN_Cryun17cG0007600 [Craigia yunnanensis]
MNRIAIESDSLNSISTIKNGVPTNHPLVSAIKDILDRDWLWTLDHIPRQKNMAADWIAKCSCNQNRGLEILTTPPPGPFFYLTP